MIASNYTDFIESKTQWSGGDGFDAGSLPSWLYDFQSHLVAWSLRKGRSAIFADCGMGKTPMQLAWADEVVKRENKSVLIATPLAVGQQTVSEAIKFGIEASRSRDGAIPSSASIVVTNYEQLHKFDPQSFAGVVCDESSCIKDMKTARKAMVVEFMRTVKYRLLCTATAAPNDYWELGTSSEALGLMGWRDMITTFFKMETSKDRRGWGRTKYRFRGHAENPFWSWVCSWARSLQKPSDIGFDDTRFKLPPLSEKEVLVKASIPRDGYLFDLPAMDMREEREEARRTIKDRCEVAADIANNHDGSCVLWCNLNDEGDLLDKLCSDSVQVKGSMSDDERESRMQAFSEGNVKQIVIKPKIGAWGMNWQHCSKVVMFPSHSFEQYYQAVRRCYRFGQVNPVEVSLITTEGSSGILKNLQRKKNASDTMFRSIVNHMQDALHLAKSDTFIHSENLPSWLVAKTNDS